jgi:putative acetyltransferase
VFKPSSVTIKFEQVSPDTANAVALIGELDAYLNQLPYTPDSRHAFSVDKLIREGVVFFIATLDGDLAGCGGIKLFGTEYAEVKRMFVRPVHRGKGLGKAILNHLASYVDAQQIKLLRLETGIYQAEAIGLYEAWGFKRRSPFGEYKEHPLSLYFEKPL